MNPAVFSLHNLCVQLSKKDILRSISLDIPKGSCTAIIGPNGAGKTTLLKCLNRILTPSSGTLHLNDQPLSDYTQKDIARQVAYVPQASTTSFEFTVHDFVMLGRYPHLSPFTAISSADKEAVTQALTITHLLPFRDRNMTTLSGGERQAVFIAAALAQEASILLMDEPTTYLDYKHQVDVLDLIKRLHTQEDMTIVLVTHDVNHAVAVADHIVALTEGQVQFKGTPEALLQGDTLDTVFDTPFQRIPLDGSPLPLILPGGPSA